MFRVFRKRGTTDPDAVGSPCLTPACMTESRSVTQQDAPREQPHFFTKSNQFVVTVKGAVLPGP
jgi:hypothetical protein